MIHPYPQVVTAVSAPVGFAEPNEPTQVHLALTETARKVGGYAVAPSHQTLVGGCVYAFQLLVDQACSTFIHL